MALEIVRGGRPHRLLLVTLSVAVLLVLLRLPFAYGSYRVFQFTLVMIWAIAVMGLNLLVGYNGQISIGHNAFFAVGAYTAAILMHRYEANLVLCLVAAALLTFLLGVAVGIPALRLRGLHLAIVTLALAMATAAILQRFESLTGGATGLRVRSLAPPEWLHLANDQYLYFIALTIAIVMFVVARALTRSAFGRAIVAIKDNQLAAEAMGVDPRVFKVLTFAISGMYAGVAGVLYVLAVNYVSPEAFPLLMSVTFLAAIAVGGLSTVQGAIIGAVFVQFVPQFASEVNASLATLIYGVILIAFMILAPRGLAGLSKRVSVHLVRVIDPLDRADRHAPDTALTVEPYGAGSAS
ncbi:MAG: branched-chain amino acid ABC transporter permease [Ilumatobacteraceae bacterium]